MSHSDIPLELLTRTGSCRPASVENITLVHRQLQLSRIHGYTEFDYECSHQAIAHKARSDTIHTSSQRLTAGASNATDVRQQTRFAGEIDCSSFSCNKAAPPHMLHTCRWPVCAATYVLAVPRTKQGGGAGMIATSLTAWLLACKIMSKK